MNFDFLSACQYIRRQLTSIPGWTLEGELSPNKYENFVLQKGDKFVGKKFTNNKKTWTKQELDTFVFSITRRL